MEGPPGSAVRFRRETPQRGRTTVEVYDPATGRWRTVAGLPTARWSPGAGAISGKVYAVGGGGNATQAVNQVYTP
jgi:hypothetical protein